ncbi:IclR family transcriptional regulator [Alkalihalophilus marmarensis]|uniref:IclR family transcriptional regulator n=1 Tax=Alkalihalophilus marmarensis TaxID=521377 RepID=UPI002E1C7BAA|nr:IclR family transcriptional regulator [Alkalihalophilus marmarensis]
MQNTNKTVIKSMKLLHLFRTNPTLTLNEMVDAAGLPKTSVHRMVTSLEEAGLLQRDGAGSYKLGLLFLEFGQLVTERMDLRKIALPYMEELRDQIGEAVNLTIKDQLEALYIEKLDTTHPVRLFTKVGRRSPLYAGACSRIILAHMAEEDVESYLQEQKLTAYGNGTITDAAKLRDILSDSRKKGIAISRSELENGTTSVAAPIFDFKGEIAGGLSIAGPSERFSDDKIQQMIDQLKHASYEISKELGYKEPHL